MKENLKNEYINDFYTMLSFYIIMVMYRLVELMTNTNTFLFVGLLIGYGYLGYWCYQSYQKSIFPKVYTIIKIVLVAMGILPMIILSFSYSTIEIINIMWNTIFMAMISA